MCESTLALIHPALAISSTESHQSILSLDTNKLFRMAETRQGQGEQPQLSRLFRVATSDDRDTQ